MNINDIPEPPIKPTKLPSIVMDQDREVQFSLGQSLEDATIQNHNAHPSKGGLFANFMQYLEAQQQTSQAQNRKPTQTITKSPVARPIKKKGSPTWAIIIIIAWIGFGIIGSIVDTIDSSTGIESSIITDPIPTSPPTLTKSTECLELTLPEDRWFFDTGLKQCEVRFDGGYSLSRSAVIGLDGEYYYANADEFLMDRGIVPSATVEINNRQAFIIEESDDPSQSEYLFWIRDLGITDDTGELIDSVSFYLYDSGYDAQESADIVLSVKFNAAQE